MTADVTDLDVAAAAGEPARLDGGTYELLRARLAEHTAELHRRAGALYERRVEAFGAAAMELLGTERIRTENNCVPRDIVSVGGLMLFGYNVYIGLKPETTVDDVFSTHTFSRDGSAFRFDSSTDGRPELLRDAHFQRDFTELYRYYRDTCLLQLRRVEDELLAVFQTGRRTDDIKVLRWNVAPDGATSYVDNRGERDHVFPPSHDFTWTETTRDDQVFGRYPHLSILGQVFVETIGGTLTVKIENNTDTGEGIYSEPFDEPLQSLADADADADADVAYA